MTDAENNLNQLPRMAVGVMGSAGGDLAAEVCERVERFGKAVGERERLVKHGETVGHGGGRHRGALPRI